MIASQRIIALHPLTLGPEITEKNFVKEHEYDEVSKDDITENAD